MSKLLWKIRVWFWARRYGYGKSSWHLAGTFCSADTDYYGDGYGPKEAVLEALSYGY